jgi:hypothetical protein
MAVRTHALSAATVAGIAASTLCLGACLFGGKVAEETRGRDAGEPVPGPTSSQGPASSHSSSPAASSPPMVRQTSGGPCCDPPAGTQDASPEGPDSSFGTTFTPYAVAGDLVTLVTGQSAPYMLAVDATSVYWPANGDGTIMKVSIHGGPLTTLATGQEYANGIAVDATSVYWVSSGLMKLPLDGGTPIQLATDFMNDNIAVGPSGIYGTSPGDAPVSVPLAGGTTKQLGPTVGSSNTYGIAVDSTSLYWTEFGNPVNVLKVSLAGGTPIVLATGTVPEGLAVDATSVYWVDAGGAGATGSLNKVPLGGGPSEVLANGLEDPTGLAIDETYAYVTTGFSSGTPGEIVKVPLAGGPLTVLAGGLDGPSGIAVDVTSVYWTNVSNERSGAGSIMKLTPK